MRQFHHHMRTQAGMFTASPRLGIPSSMSTTSSMQSPTAMSMIAMTPTTEDTLHRRRVARQNRPPPLGAVPLRRSNSTIGIRRIPPPPLAHQEVPASTAALQTLPLQHPHHLLQQQRQMTPLARNSLDRPITTSAPLPLPLTTIGLSLARDLHHLGLASHTSMSPHHMTPGLVDGPLTEYFPMMPPPVVDGVGAGGASAGAGAGVGAGVGSAERMSASATATTAQMMMVDGEDVRSLPQQQARGVPLALDMAATAAAVMHNSRITRNTPIRDMAMAIGDIRNTTHTTHHPHRHQHIPTLTNTSTHRRMDQADPAGWTAATDSLVGWEDEEVEVEYMTENRQSQNLPFLSTLLVSNDPSQDRALAVAAAEAAVEQHQARQLGGNAQLQIPSLTAMDDQVHQVEAASSLLDDLTRGMRRPPVHSLDGSPSWKYATMVQHHQEAAQVVQADDSFPFLDRPLQTHESSLHRDLGSLSPQQELTLVPPPPHHQHRHPLGLAHLEGLPSHSPIQETEQLQLSVVPEEDEKANVMLHLRQDQERILRNQRELQEQMQSVQAHLQSATRDQYQALSNSMNTIIELENEVEKQMMQMSDMQQQQQQVVPQNQNQSPHLLQSQVPLQQHRQRLQQQHEAFQHYPDHLQQLDPLLLSAPQNHHSQNPPQSIHPLTMPPNYHHNVPQNNKLSRSHHNTPTHPLFPFHRSPSTSTATSATGSELSGFESQRDLNGTIDLSMDLGL